ncbi:GyrI-like domain-containing protein [Eubacteriales bacterium OttesenSCG-928-N13]|nr:GyrI-like domain-containing protein [Eubacteriales bacterium OttesenSCG-928-N13]
MDVRFVTREDTSAIGYAIMVKPMDPEISKLWEKIHGNGDFQRLMAKSGKMENFGLCIMQPDRQDDLFKYMIAVDHDPAKEIDADMEQYTVQGGEYAVFHAPTMAEIKPTFSYIYETWLPTSEYAFDESRNADFEYYFMDGTDIACAVYVPVIMK